MQQSTYHISQMDCPSEENLIRMKLEGVESIRQLEFDIENSVSIYLLQKSKSKEPHMKASMIFSSNDSVINFGVIVAGLLVLLTQPKYPDLIIGSIVIFIVVQGAFRILKLGK